MTSLRERRICNEWRLLHRFAEANPDMLEVNARSQDLESESFHVTLDRTSALICSPSGVRLVNRHQITIRMPDFFPAVPMQVFLIVPVLHPNVHPSTGFVCLWDRFNPGDTAITALRQLQRVISWEIFNTELEHLMQSEACQLYRQQPLPYTPLQMQPEFERERIYHAPKSGKFRSRLSALE
jgi:ubiquitin-protein ligase